MSEDTEKPQPKIPKRPTPPPSDSTYKSDFKHRPKQPKEQTKKEN